MWRARLPSQSSSSSSSSSSDESSLNASAFSSSASLAIRAASSASKAYLRSSASSAKSSAGVSSSCINLVSFATLSYSAALALAASFSRRIYYAFTLISISFSDSGQTRVASLPLIGQAGILNFTYELSRFRSHSSMNFFSTTLSFPVLGSI